MKQQRKTSVIVCIAVLLAAVMGLAVYSSVRLKSPGTEDNNADNKAAVNSATIRALSYDIDLKLDTEKERVEQTVFMDIINKSGDEDFSSLYIRYYPNGYIDALMKENPEIKGENEGRSSAVTSVTWKGSEEQLKITYDQDDTLIKVDLGADPLKAGETVTDHVVIHLVLQYAVTLPELRFTVLPQHDLTVLISFRDVRCPLLRVTHLMDHFLHSSPQLRVLASLAPPDLFLHNRDNHSVQVVVIYILAKSLADFSVQLISMHDCRDYILGSELLLDEVECFLIESLCVLIASMIFEVLCVDIDDDLIEQGSILP